MAFRILIVEDEEPTSRRLIQHVQSVIPDSDFAAASSVEEAEAMIQKCGLEGAPFDVVILDSQLPMGGKKEISTQICGLISRSMPEAFVIHFTAFSEDEVFRKHFDDMHVRSAGPRGFLLPKQSRWDHELVRQLVKFKLEQQLEKWFRERAGSAAGWFSRTGSTFGLADLMSDIQRYWRRLPEGTKQRIRLDFDISEYGDTVTVRLGGTR